MKLHRTDPSSRYSFTGYGEDYVLINGERHDSSVIVMADEIRPWSAASFQSLSPENLSELKELGAEIVLIGTGPRQRFPDPRLTVPLAKAGIGVEVMDLQAACRTYNILVAEERKVAAALLFA